MAEGTFMGHFQNNAFGAEFYMKEKLNVDPKRTTSATEYS